MKDPGYIMYIVFYPEADIGSPYETQYTTEADHKQAILDMYTCLNSGGYCVVTRFNESEIVRTKSQLWEFKF